MYKHDEVSVTDPYPQPGRVIKAPESFLSRDDIRTVHGQAKAGRRDFIRNAFASAMHGADAGGVEKILWRLEDASGRRLRVGHLGLSVCTFGYKHKQI